VDAEPLERALPNQFGEFFSAHGCFLHQPF
jgi:hypothetical protein